MLLLFLWLVSCGGESKSIDYLKLPVFTENGVNAVVEIPAGTNHKIEINKENGKFENDSVNGHIRIIEFLPYPGNYGFIPSTVMEKERGGDGDAMDVLILSESDPTGTVIEIKPIASLLLRDEGEMDTKIIAVPVDSSRNVLQVFDYQSLMIEKQAAKRMIEDWFLNYDGAGVMELLGWRDEKFTIQEIKKWAN